MAIIRWNPWNISSLMDEDWNLPTIPGLSRLGQGLNIYETEEALIAEAALPGIPEDKIDITVEDGIVRVTGSIEQTQADKSDRRYFMSSMASSYNYSFRLPPGVLADEEPRAEVEDGVLTLTFRKTERVAPKKVRVVKRAKESAK
jgi:HSP20 family protein